MMKESVTNLVKTHCEEAKHNKRRKIVRCCKAATVLEKNYRVTSSENFIDILLGNSFCFFPKAWKAKASDFVSSTH